MTDIGDTPPCQKPFRPYSPIRYDLGFDTEGNTELNLMHREAQWLLNDIANQPEYPQLRPRWLSLLGKPGTGKTHLAKAIRETVPQIRPRLTCQYWRWIDVVNRLRSGDYGILDHLKMSVSVLILDDIGAEYKSEFSNGALYDIMDYRIGKWTVITSNLLPADFAAAIDPRISSRLRREGSRVAMVEHAPDYARSHYNDTPDIPI